MNEFPFLPRKRYPRDGAATGPLAAAGRDEPFYAERHLQAWRESARAVSRAWNAWLAAEGHQRHTRYDRYVAALDDEQHAADTVAQALQGEAQLPQTSIED